MQGEPLLNAKEGADEGPPPPKRITRNDFAIAVCAPPPLGISKEHVAFFAFVFEIYNYMYVCVLVVTVINYTFPSFQHPSLVCPGRMLCRHQCYRGRGRHRSRE
jgi:hypothetical protein